MTVTINLIKTKPVKTLVWKTLNVLVGITTILNVSMIGALVAPQRVSAQEVPVSDTAPASVSPDSVTTGAVCPPGNVKVNDGTGVEYTDGSAAVSIVPGDPHNTTTWSVAPGYVITDVCVKIGGSGGGSLVYPDPLAGNAGPYSHDISHVVVTTRPFTSNPPLGQSCGLDIGLIVDRSGSVSSSEMSDMKTALTNFANAFDGTPTVFSLASFATNSTLDRAFSHTPTQMASDIGTDIPSAGSGNTNWDSGLARSLGSFDPRPAKSNLMVIATDGSPNRWGYPVTDPGTYWEPQNAGSNWGLGLTNAIERANAVKTAGTRIVVVGIGNDGDDHASAAQKLQKMKDISGPNVALTPGAITTSTDVIKVTDFTGIGAALSSFASELCGGKILVQKQYDTNADGTPEYDGSVPNAALADWDFDVNGSPSNPVPQTTTNTGSLEFSVQNGTYSVTETSVKPNTRLDYAQCINGTQPVGTVNLDTRTVSGLTMDTDDTISCVFRNEAVNGRLIIDKVTNPSGDPQVFSFDASGGSYADFTLTDAQAPNDQALVAGTYSVSETVPAGWDQTSATCSDGSPVNAIVLSADETVTCTFTNTRKGHLIVQKTTDPAADPTVFSISASGTGTITGGGAGTVTDALDKNYEVTPGTYSVTETVPAGWSKTGDTCQDVTVAAGETKYCTLTNTRDTGFLTVNKMVDPENDGSFVGVGGDDTPFRWGVDALDGPTTPRYMGATATGIPTVTPFNVNENLSDVPGYHFAGWYYTNDAAQLDNNRTYNCTTPQFISMPTGLTVAKNGTTQITLCNARDTGDLTINKYDDDENPLSGVTFTAGPYSGQTDESGMLVFSNIPTGPYVVTETKPDNYHFSSVSGDCSPNANPTNVTVTTAGEQCTFTNARDMGGLRIIKQVNNDFGGTKGPGDFLINVKQSGTDIPGSPFAGVGDPGQLFPLPTGEYTISEDSVPDGYALQSIDCQEDDLWSLDRASSVGVPPTSQTVEIGEGEEITCTVTNNDQPGTLIVRKVLVNDNGGTQPVTSFSFKVNDGSSVYFDGDAQNDLTVNADTYSIIEDETTGYATTYDNCSEVVIPNGGTATCTITNDDQQATLTVIKHVVNDNGGTVTASNFTMNVTGTAATASFPGAETPGTTINVNPGNYYVDESGGPSGYTASFDGDCDDSIALGEHKTCTITNVRDTGTVKVNKQVDADGNGTFETGNDGANALGFRWSLDGGEANRLMGSSETVTTIDNHTVNENTVANFHPVGWFYNNNETSCTDLELNPLPANVTVSKNDTTEITICNARDTGRITFDKVVTDNPSAESLFAFAVNGSGSYHDGDAVTLPTGSYPVTESAVPGYAFVSASGICTLVEGSIVMNVSTDGGTCTITNRQLFPDLTVTKTDGLTTANPGQQLAYTMVVSNVGEFAADNVTVNDTLPAQATYLSSTLNGVNAPAAVTPNPAGDQLSWNIGSLANGVSKTLLVTVALDATFPFGTTLLHNAVTVATTTTEPNTGNNSASDDTNVSASPTLGLQKSADPTTVPAGTNVNWTVTWSVSGNANATNVVIVDPIPANSTFVSVADGGVYDAVTNKVTWNLGTQSPGASGLVHYVTKTASPITNGTVITNTATIDSAETDPAISASASVTVTSAPDLTIVKTSSVTTFTNPGQPVTYTVTVTNKATATDTAKNVVLTDTLPSGFTFAVDGTTTKSFTIGDLTPGQSATVTYLVNISGSQTAGTYNNSAKAKGDNTTEVTATTPVEVRVPQVLAAATPDLAISKVVNKSTAKPGDVVTYTITVKNTGDGDAANVVITDTLPKDLSFVHGTGRTMTWEIGTLEAGRSRVVNVDVRVESDAKSGDYENVAAVTADDLPQQQATAKLTVKTPKVLGLATTGAGPLDYFLALLGAALIWAGLLGLKRRQPELAQ